MDAKPKFEYRPDIDGMRAIAVVSVVIFHVLPGALPGGFVGVDVFFVISGYLISGIIIREIATSTFSFSNFYSRRIKRIFPALIIVLLATMIIGWYTLLIDEFTLLGKHIKTSAVYIINIVLRKEVGYFDVASQHKPLLHLWSLAIEEQFYLLWPLLLAFIYKRVRFLALPLVALMLYSFARNIGSVETHHFAKAFYLLPSRAWELLMGAYLAHLEVHSSIATRHTATIFATQTNEASPSRIVVSKSADTKAAAGAMLLFCALAFLNNDKLFPGWWALAPTVGAALLISAGPTAWINRNLLSRREIVFVGVISYPLYLWHWPILSFGRILGYWDESPVRTMAISVILSFMLAYITYAFVEQPIRSSRKFATTTVLFVAMALIGLVGSSISSGRIRPLHSSPLLDRIVAASGEWSYPSENEAVDGLKLVSIKAKSEIVAFLGDSNMQQYWPRIEYLIRKNPKTAKSAVFLAWGGCIPIPGVKEDAHPQCEEKMESAFKFLRKREIKVVVIAAEWHSYMTGSQYYVPRLGYLGADKSATASAYDNLKMLIRDLKASGARVYLVLNIPTGPKLDPKRLIQRRLGGNIELVAGGYARREIDSLLEQTNHQLRQVATASGATVIDPVGFLCTTVFCPAITKDGEPIYKDSSHLRPSFVRESVTFLDAIVLN